MIQDFVNDICDILNISVPSVSFDTSNFQTDTMMAQCSSDGSIIYIKCHDKLNPDLFFAIAHELRHTWQMRNDKNLYFSTYKPINLCASVEEYNLQISELDSNAFAGLIMEKFFRIKPLFQGLPDSTKESIYNRIEYLKSTELLK